MRAQTKRATQPLVGADVECFLYTGSEPTSIVPCVGIIPGTKKDPMPLGALPKGYAAQEDNVMVEFNIPPSKSPNAFLDSMTKSRMGVMRYLTTKYPDKGYGLTFISANKFHPKALESEQAQTIGCDPDFDAYVGGEVRSVLPKLDNWRGAGGHVHLGGDFQCPDFVAALFADVMIGLGCGVVGMRGSPRDQWYGRPGIFRPKPYGIEYRSPSGEWAGSKHTTASVGTMAHRLVRWLSESDAKHLQTVFRRVKWADVRSALTYDPGMNQDDREIRHSNVREHCRQAGVPL